jgi:hypothetical protein
MIPGSSSSISARRSARRFGLSVGSMRSMIDTIRS